VNQSDKIPGSPPVFGPTSASEAVRWEPSGVVSTMWIPLGSLIGLFALFILGLLYSIVGARPEAQELSVNWIAIVLLSLAILAIHQLLHCGVARLIGARPRYDLDVIHWVMPVMYCRVDEHEFTRRQFFAYSLSPLVFPLVVVSALTPFDERAIHGIIPVAVNSAFSVRDVWMSWTVYREREAGMIAVQRDGLWLRRV
jgi:hypothetical protein